ncbi:Copper Transporter integral membrane protein that functions in high affinity copper transport [Sporothrix curviconia]|uniref:Copper transport protein n=1 Tax=Sporothrix curviconia TaxID=1260050 RepID=A0ABP0CE16_9PEZI
MDMTMTSATATASAALSSASSSSDMDMGTGACKISMLWNWNTIDTCFIARSWHITSRGMFAGSCIGVVLLVMTLEALRRAVKEYDRYLVRTHRQMYRCAANPAYPAKADSIPGFHPSLPQQAVRALLHVFQFAVAYFVMLLAMYYNGYFIICILIGAYLGGFVFHWETMGESAPSKTSAASEATVCCG